MVPDYMALPCAPDVWTVQAGPDAVQARLGPDDGFSAEPDLAAALLAQAADAGPPRAALLLGEPDETIKAVFTAAGVPVFGDVDALVGAGHPRPLRWSEAARGIDLKDPPSATFDRLRDGMKAWRMPVVFAVLALTAFLATIVLETRRLHDQSNADLAAARALVREYFVPAGPILDMRAQVAAAVAAATQPQAAAASDRDPLILFQSVAPLLDRDGVSVQTVSYRSDTGLVIAANVPDFLQLDTLVADLRRDGFLVDLLESSARQSGGVAARMRLAGAQG
jgi:general secretion pathway protein L